METQSYPVLSQDQNVQKLYEAFLLSFIKLSDILRYSTSDKQMDSKNKFGDVQLQCDMECDDIIFEELKKIKIAKFGLSEEKPELIKLDGEQPYIVTFDPLDGSSIIGCNWSVGSIFGIWKDQSQLIGQKCTDIIGAGICMYGPRTTCIVINSDKKCVQELTLKRSQNGQLFWAVSKEKLNIKPKTKIFAPGNLRAVNEHAPYKKLVDYWITNKYTLRYTGGMVPDVYQIFIKSEGIFSTLATEQSPPKLRLLYEVAPIAALVEAAGGKTTDGKQSILDMKIEGYDQRSGIVCGSAEEVDRLLQYLKE